MKKISLIIEIIIIIVIITFNITCNGKKYDDIPLIKDKPILLTPSNNSELENLQPNFTWKEVQNAEYYTLYINNEKIIDTKETYYNYPSSLESDSNEYSWYVEASNKIMIKKSENFIFRKSDKENPTITITSHNNNDAIYENTKITGTITDDTGIKEVIIYINDKKIDVTLDENGNFEININIDDYSNGIYIIKIIVTDYSNNEIQKELSLSFVKDGVILVKPNSGDNICINNVVFEWELENLDADYYVIQVCKSTNFDNLEYENNNIKEKTLSTNELESGYYYWRIQAVFGNIKLPFTKHQSFSLLNETSGLDGLVNPENNCNNKTFEFKWNNPDSVDCFIECKRTIDTSWESISQNNKNSSFTTTLSIPGEYSWRIKKATEDICGYSQWTYSTTTFIVENCYNSANNGNVIINEISWMGSYTSSGTDNSDDEFIELKNQTTNTYNLDNWKIKNAGTGSTEITLSGYLPAESYYVVSKYNNKSIIGSGYNWYTTNLELDNNGEILTLYDAASNLIDVTPNPENNWANYGMNDTSNKIRRTMERNISAGNGNNWCNWHTSNTATGTYLSSSYSYSGMGTFATPGEINGNYFIFDDFDYSSIKCWEDHHFDGDGTAWIASGKLHINNGVNAGEIGCPGIDKSSIVYRSLPKNGNFNAIIKVDNILPNLDANLYLFSLYNQIDQYSVRYGLRTDKSSNPIDIYFAARTSYPPNNGWCYGPINSNLTFPFYLKIRKTGNIYRYSYSNDGNTFDNIVVSNHPFNPSADMNYIVLSASSVLGDGQHEVVYDWVKIEY